MAKDAPTQVGLKRKSMLEAPALKAGDGQGAALPPELCLGRSR